MKRKVTILGAGLVGSLLAVILRNKGYEVTIYERRPDMRQNTLSAGRSINLAMSVRGWKALEIAGLRSAIESLAIPMSGRFLHQMDGSNDFQAYGKKGESIYSVSRGELNMKLMDLAEEKGAKIVFDHKCINVDVPNNRISLLNEKSNEEIVLQCDLLFGADGAYSALRTSYGFLDRTNYNQQYIEAGYKELSIPGNVDGSWKMEKNALHIWPRGKFMMIALPNQDGSFTNTLFLPFEGAQAFEHLNTDEEIMNFFKEYFPDAIPLMPTLLEDFHNNPTSSLITLKIFPWVYKDQSCLIGDAAHAIVPFYGQGMNAGFEDCSVLNELMDKYVEDWTTILKEYQERRKPNGDAILDLALMNFIEMRDKVADDQFLMRKKIEKEIGKMYPDVFNSVYEMVSFTHTPYAFALESSNAQDQLFEKIFADGDFYEQINTPEYRSKLDGWIREYANAIKNIKDYQ